MGLGKIFFFLAFCLVFVDLLIFNILNDAVFESILCFRDNVLKWDRI